eukprot:5048485-Pleurochrysis_carterae.AAC.1
MRAQRKQLGADRVGLLLKRTEARQRGGIPDRLRTQAAENLWAAELPCGERRGALLAIHAHQHPCTQARQLLSRWVGHLLDPLARCCHSQWRQA